MLHLVATQAHRFIKEYNVHTYLFNSLQYIISIPIIKGWDNYSCNFLLTWNPIYLFLISRLTWESSHRPLLRFCLLFPGSEFLSWQFGPSSKSESVSLRPPLWEVSPLLSGSGPSSSWGRLRPGLCPESLLSSVVSVSPPGSHRPMSAPAPASVPSRVVNKQFIEMVQSGNKILAWENNFLCRYYISLENF